MIKLFNINDYQIDTSELGNLLHGEIVQAFEKEFAEYVGAKYACFADSASSLLYLSLRGLNTTIKIPSIIPPVVPNVIINSGNKLEFYDDIDWVGGMYELYPGIWDSAQRVDRDQYHKFSNCDSDVMIFSFYPTKPIGGCDGGKVVSDDKEVIDWYKAATLNGMKYSENNWEREHIFSGYKMHFNSVSAYIANENLKKLDKKHERLDEIRDAYNAAFDYNNDSRHLYRIRVKDNKSFISEMKNRGILCGIHYEHCHGKRFYNVAISCELDKSEQESIKTVSLPYHENMTKEEINKVIKDVKQVAKI